jgi:uncharacterized protein YcfL
MLYWYDEQGNRFRTQGEQAAEFELRLARYRERFAELPGDE